MSCKQYRACLMGVIAVGLICVILLLAKYGKENQIPADGILVEQIEEQDGVFEWA